MSTLGRSLGRALHTVEDYERAAREHPAVRHVKVIAAQTDPRAPAGAVEIRVQRRFRRPVSERVVREVREGIAARHPVGVRLKVSTRWL